MVTKPKHDFWLVEGPDNFTRRATGGKLNLPVVRLIVLVCVKWQRIAKRDDKPQEILANTSSFKMGMIRSGRR